MTILLMTHLTMKKLKVYISCPMSVPIERLETYAKEILKMGADVEYWARGTTYTNYALKRADVMVVLLEKNAWKASMSTISRGTCSEIRTAWEEEIDVYLAYINGQNEYAIYDTTQINGMLTGVAGTSDKFRKMVEQWNKGLLSPSERTEQLKQAVITEYYNDRRHAPVPVPVEEDEYSSKYSDELKELLRDPHVSVSHKIIDFGTPGGYDRRLLLLLR